MFSKITLAQFPQVAIFGKANVKEPIRVVVIILFFLIVFQIRKSQSSKWNSERAERYKLTEFMNSDRKLALGTKYLKKKKVAKKGKMKKFGLRYDRIRTCSSQNTGHMVATTSYPCELNSQFSGNSLEFSEIPNYANDPRKLNSQFSGNSWEFLGTLKNSQLCKLTLI